MEKEKKINTDDLPNLKYFFTLDFYGFYYIFVSVLSVSSLRLFIRRLALDQAWCLVASTTNIYCHCVAITYSTTGHILAPGLSLLFVALFINVIFFPASHS